MGSKQPLLTDSPWFILGGYKYVIYIPFLVKAIHAGYFGGHDIDDWCFHMLLVSGLRFLHGQIWSSICRLHFLVKNHQVTSNCLSFEQIDREFHSDDHVLLQMLVLTVAHVGLASFRQLPLWEASGLVIVLVLHVGPTEFLYYWLHRALHADFFFKNYHYFHHASVQTEPATGGVSTFLEQIFYAALTALPLVGAALLGSASISMIYIYWMAYDFLKNMAHCNVEFIPVSVLRVLPFLRYILITPSYHSLHHAEGDANFCLFVPFYDYLGGTVHPKTRELHALLRRGRREQVPDFVFLAHIVDMLSAIHVSFMIRSFAAQPYVGRWFIWPLLPVSVFALLAMSVCGRLFVAYSYSLDKVFAQTWVVPRFGFQYFVPVQSCMDTINGFIESAILEADRKGVKVISLAALNKNESLNGGGVLFVKKHKDLRVRVVHGNTLTAACILKSLPEHETEVFMNGATSKLGRAIAIYLSRRHVRVMMLTSSKERFEAIVEEAPEELRHYMVRVSSYQSAKHCKTWIMGKWIADRDQRCAPKGTHFHQFVVPPIRELRKDCTYGKLAAMRLPRNVKGIYSCEVTCNRGVVHACHAGGLIHHLEGWTHHEVGHIDVDRIDTVWEAAMKHGFAGVA